jgi:cellulose synthase/poly-beta-1,6-N-acetylglucosamine synthase-like glycosyltransferase
MESSIHSVPGATGSIYAIRKVLFEPIPRGTLLDDVFVPMKIISKGYRSVFDSKAIAYDTISRDFAEEKKRKVRTLIGNYQLLGIMPELLSLKKNPIFFSFISHKILRLFVPFFFLIIVVSSLLMSGFIYKLSLIISTGTLLLPLGQKIFTKVPYVGMLSTMARTFVSLNYFALLAFLHLIWPRKKKVW